MARTQGSHSEITGPRIHATAMALFAEHGYAAVSMRQIASSVGVQVGALYNYIPDKQALLFTLLETHMQEVLTAWRARPRPMGALAQLESFVQFHIPFHLERREAVFISYMELRNLTPENFAAIEALRHEYEDALDGILRRGQAEGVFAVADSRLTTYALLAMLTGVTTWYRPEGRLTPQAVAAHYWEMVHRMVTTRPEPGA
jgi:AcrR family transcriptional regulator